MPLVLFRQCKPTEKTMIKILRSTIAATFAVACIAGASVAFAADNGGNNNGDNGGKNNNANAGKIDKDNKCANDASGTTSTDCTMEPNDAQ
jgi:hypothetical protein